MNTFPPAALRAIKRCTSRIRAVRDRLRTERIINQLPARIRKDIGWPDAFDEQRADRFGGHDG
jgi:hypothetical protein